MAEGRGDEGPDASAGDVLLRQAPICKGRGASMGFRGSVRLPTRLSKARRRSPSSYSLFIMPINFLGSLNLCASFSAQAHSPNTPQLRPIKPYTSSLGSMLFSR